MPTLSPKQILIAPLDWGLGHTARCVSLIRHIKALGHHPIVAGNAAQQTFIKETFGTIDFIHLDGYNITYSKWNRFGQAGIISQLPRVHKMITYEREWLQQLSLRLHIDGVISDNRYGLFHPNIPSVIMTHQLMALSGIGNVIDREVQKVHYKYLERFNSIWVVDAPGFPNLAGKLSHTHILPRNTNYIGLLSRFEGTKKEYVTGQSLLVLLSGPEPQRSILSGILWQQVLRHNGTVTFIEGSNNAVTPVNIPRHITYHKLITDEKLAPLLHQAGIVVCRSGYSTIMDLVALSKKAILIPTPGQTEQEYLALHLHSQGIFFTKKQSGFNLDNALKESLQFPYNLPSLNNSYTTYRKVVAEWLDAL